jgi:hypothetical protein
MCLFLVCSPAPVLGNYHVRRTPGKNLVVRSLIIPPPTGTANLRPQVQRTLSMVWCVLVSPEGKTSCSLFVGWREKRGGVRSCGRDEVSKSNRGQWLLFICG